MKHYRTDDIASDGSLPLLIVDDSHAATAAMERLLQEEGFPTVSFPRGLPALKFVQSLPVRAALVDVHIPDLSGLVLIGELRRLLGPEVPIIAISGDSSMETLNSLTLLGATWFYQKPISGRQLINRLKMLLGLQHLLPADEQLGEIDSSRAGQRLSISGTVADELAAARDPL